MSRRKPKWKARIDRLLKMAGSEAGTRPAPVALPSGKHYLTMQKQVEELLMSALKADPERVRVFFERFSHVRPYDIERIKSFIQKPDRKKKHEQPDVVMYALKSYINFVLRFGVRFKLDVSKERFMEKPLGLSERKLCGHILQGNLVPKMTRDTDDEAEFSCFADDKLELPKGCEAELEKCSARWLQIDDRQGTSLLAQIEQVGYSPDHITFVYHNSLKEVLFCMVGENTSDKEWKDAGKLRTKFQQAKYGTAIKGRKPNLAKRVQQYKLLGEPGPMKEKAIDMIGGAGIERQVNTAGRDLRRRKAEVRTERK